MRHKIDFSVTCTTDQLAAAITTTTRVGEFVSVEVASLRDAATARALRELGCALPDDLRALQKSLEFYDQAQRAPDNGEGVRRDALDGLLDAVRTLLNQHTGDPAP